MPSEKSQIGYVIMGTNINIVAQRKHVNGEWLEIRHLPGGLGDDEGRGFVRVEWFTYRHYDFLGLDQAACPIKIRGLPKDLTAEQMHDLDDGSGQNYFLISELLSIDWESLYYETSDSPYIYRPLETKRQILGQRFIDWINDLAVCGIERISISFS
jgi:hypothetical protein